MRDDESSITAGEMLDWLKAVPRSTKIRFQGPLHFDRFKWRADDLVQIEFAEPVHDALEHYRKTGLKEG